MSTKPGEPYLNGRDTPSQPGDGHEGTWSRDRLLQMDARFTARVQRAIERGQEHGHGKKKPSRSGGFEVRLWVVAVTWPRCERRVARALTRNGFDFYLPKCRTAHQRVGLLFPRYVFAGPPERWVALRQIYGVSRLLRTGENLTTVPDEAVAALKSREDHEGCVKLPRPPHFRPGQRVRITLGAFTGLTGVYRGGKRDREWVELTLGQVTLPVGNLIAE